MAMPPMETDAPLDADRNPFWDFSVGFYNKPGVAAACLHVQDRHGIDVNLLLFGVWAAVAGRPALDRAAFADLMTSTAAWHAIVRTVRSARRMAKQGHSRLAAAEAEAAYRGILAVELDLERIEQLIIMRAAAGPQSEAPLAAAVAAQRARGNMDACLEAAGVVADDRDRAALETIASALLDGGLAEGSGGTPRPAQ